MFLGPSIRKGWRSYQVAKRDTLLVDVAGMVVVGVVLQQQRLMLYHNNLDDKSRQLDRLQTKDEAFYQC